MGLAKVLFLRGSKETDVPKCARVDSLGLAKRRLAAKAAREELGADAADLDGIGAGRDGDIAPAAPDLLEPVQQDDSEASVLGRMGRQHRDSIRIHRRRFRASLDLPSSRTKNAFMDKGVSWSSGGSPNSPGAQGGQDNEQDNVGDDAAPERASCPTNDTRHVRFRRASDGEYLTASRTHKAAEGAIPHALKAVQLKAERLFRRITANFTEPHPPRPRSATPSRGGSPTRPQRTSAGRAAPASRAASGSRSSASWGLGLRHRSASSTTAGAAAAGVEADDGQADDGDVKAGRISPSAAARAAAAAEEDDGDAGGRPRWTAKRQSAPGELFFTSIVGGAAAVTETTARSPPLTPSGPQRAKSVTKGDVPGAGGVSAAPGGGSSPATGAAAAAAGGGGGGSVGKGLNWLARISRGISSGHGSSAYKAAAMAAAPPGGGGSQAAMNSPGPTRGSPEPEAAATGGQHSPLNALEYGGSSSSGGAAQAVQAPMTTAV